ncbi:MAG: hypothetical protein HYV27_19675 [Candidatus Hydrogenedentes bacterium]|nr:hypothetical protein [Candidatus Hydrogenedentota bacterium]
MLHIQIDDPELEKSLQETYGADTHAIAQDFLAFIRQERIRQDIGISITQLDAGEAMPLKVVMQEIRAKYE